MRILAALLCLMVSIAPVTGGRKSVPSGKVLELGVKLSGDKTFMGQPILYTETLTVPYGLEVSGVAKVTDPVFAGFEIEEIGTEAPHNEQRKGETVTIGGLRSFILFPKHSGTLKLGGGSYLIQTRRPVRTYDPLFGEVLNYAVDEKELAANVVSVRVRELPGKAPAGFCGIVGEYTLEYEVPEGRISVGNDAVFLLRIKGKGYLKSNDLPNLRELFPESLAVKSMSVEPRTQITFDGLMSEAEFEFTFVPSEEGDIQLPALGIPVFNPKKALYEVITVEPVLIQVQPAPKVRKEPTILVKF